MAELISTLLRLAAKVYPESEATTRRHVIECLKKGQFSVAHVKTCLISDPNMLINDLEKGLCTMGNNPDITNTGSVIGEIVPSSNPQSIGQVQYAGTRNLRWPQQIFFNFFF